MGRVTRKNEGEKLYTVEVRCEGEKIVAVKISGEFFAYPEGLIETMESSLAGVKLEPLFVSQAIAGAMFWLRGTLIGVRASDLVQDIVEAGKTP